MKYLVIILFLIILSASYSNAHDISSEDLIRISPGFDAERNGIEKISTCRILDEPKVYQLTKSITAIGGPCFIIKADGVELDGQGRTIQGDGQGEHAGIYFEGKSGIKIKNIQIRDFNTGIKSLNSNYTLLNLVRARSNGKGVHFESGNWTNIYESNFTGNKEAGILLKKEGEPLIQNVYSENNGGDGFEIIDSFHIHIKNFRVKNNSANGISLINGGNSMVNFGEIIENKGDGMVMIDSSQSKIGQLRSRNNGANGVHVISSRGLKVDQTESRLNKNSGILVYDSPGAMITSSVISNNTKNGLHLDKSERPYLTAVHMHSNGMNGLHLEESKEFLVQGSSFRNNVGSGIFAYLSHGSRIENNGFSANQKTAVSLLDSSGSKIEKSEFNGNFGSVLINNSKDVILNDLMIKNTKGDAIVLEKGSDGTNILDIDIASTQKDSKDLRVVSPGVNGVFLRDSVIGSYTFVSAQVHFQRSDGNGRILGELLTDGILDGSGENLSNEFKINEFGANIQTQSMYFEKPTTLVLRGLIPDVNRNTILRNGLVCSSRLCKALTSLDGETAMIRFYGNGNYLLSGTQNSQTGTNAIGTEQPITLTYVPLEEHSTRSRSGKVEQVSGFATPRSQPTLNVSFNVENNSDDIENEESHDIENEETNEPVLPILILVEIFLAVSLIALVFAMPSRDY